MNSETTKDISTTSNDINEKLRIESLSLQSDFEVESEKNQEFLNTDISDKVIDNANTYFLIKILSPELKNNEDKKRKHKDALINIVKVFLIFQFTIIAILLFSIIIMIFVFHGLKNDLELSYIEMIIKFVTAYITSVVVELIAMLKYIVSNVFDTSITGLVEMYKDATEKDQINNT